LTSDIRQIITVETTYGKTKNEDEKKKRQNSQKKSNNESKLSQN
jgi:hypothetical protein